MKRSFFALLSFLLLHTGFAQGIQFESAENSWSSILDKAQSENKLIFVVAYSLSCHNCEDMQKKIYPAEQSGAVYNGKYINVQLDMDKTEANDFANKYGIMAYPSYLFIDGKGELVHRAMGKMTMEQFVAMGVNSTDTAYQFFPLKNRFFQGDRSPELLKRLTLMAVDLTDYDLLGSVYEAYFSTQENWLSKENMDILLMGLKSPEQSTFPFLLKHKKDFIKAYSEAKIFNLIDEVVMNSISLSSYNYEQRDFDLTLAKAYGLKYLPADLFDQYWLLFKINHNMMKKNSSELLINATRYFDQYPCFSGHLYNNVALAFYEETKDKVYLEKALSWALKAIAIKDMFQYNDTTAALYFKLGNKEQAKVYALKAIEKANETGEDASETKALLKKIENL